MGPLARRWQVQAILSRQTSCPAAQLAIQTKCTVYADMLMYSYYILNFDINICSFLWDFGKIITNT